MSKILFSVVLMFYVNSLQAQQFHAIEHAEQQQTATPKPLIIFIYTAWCMYCQAMQKTTFKDPKVQELLSAHFYFAELDAAEKSPIAFGGKRYHHKPTGINTGYHELAVLLTEKEEQVAYPALFILNPQREILFQHQGFLTASEFIAVLKEVHTQQQFKNSLTHDASKITR